MPPSDPNLDPSTKKVREIKDNYGRKTSIEEVTGKGPKGEEILERTSVGPKGDLTRTTTIKSVDSNGVTRIEVTSDALDANGNVKFSGKTKVTVETPQPDGSVKIDIDQTDGSHITKNVKTEKVNGIEKVTTKTDLPNGQTITKVDEISTSTVNGKTVTKTNTTITSPDNKQTFITRNQIDEHNFTTRTKTPDGKIKNIESSTLDNGNVRREITDINDLKKNTKKTKFEEYDLKEHTKTTATIDEKGKIKVTVDEADLSTGLKSEWDETASSRNLREKWYANRKGNFKTDVKDAFGETWITRRERMKYMKDEAGGILHPFKRNKAYVARGREELAQIYAEQMAKEQGTGFITDDIMKAATKKANNKWNVFETLKARRLGKEALLDEGVSRGLKEVVQEAHQEGGEKLIRKAAVKEAALRAAGLAGVGLYANSVLNGSETPPITTPPIDTLPPDTTPVPGPGPSGGGDGGGGGGTPPDTITDPSTVDPNEPPVTEFPTLAPSEDPIEEEIITGVGDGNQNNNSGNNSGSNGGSNGGGSWGPSDNGQSEENITDEVLDDELSDEDELLKDDELDDLEDEDEDSIYTIPLASEDSTTQNITKNGTNPIPILAGLGLVAAAGVGAKIYIDNKKNNENSDDDEFMDDSEFEEFSPADSDLIADEWTGDETNTNLSENDTETLDYERPSFYSDTLGDEI